MCSLLSLLLCCFSYMVHLCFSFFPLEFLFFLLLLLLLFLNKCVLFLDLCLFHCLFGFFFVWFWTEFVCVAISIMSQRRSFFSSFLFFFFLNLNKLGGQTVRYRLGCCVNSLLPNQQATIQYLTSCCFRMLAFLFLSPVLSHGGNLTVYLV